MVSSLLAERLVSHVTSEHEVDERKRELVELFLLDYFGVVVGGIERESSQSARMAYDLSDLQTTLNPSQIHGLSLWASPEIAALVNGITSHGLELDDTHEMASMHPAVAVLPAMFAYIDAHPVSRETFDRAMLVAYDVMTSVGTYLGAAESYARGFHPTGVCGSLGAAAGVSVLMGLDRKQTLCALSLAANMSAGSLEFLSDGAWTKRLNAGHAASSGIRAAQLARAGFTAPETFLEGVNGFLRQYGEGEIPGRKLELEFGQGLAQTSIKLYPCCRYTHGNIDLLSEIHAEFPNIQAQDVVEIECAVIEAGATLISRPLAKKLEVKTSVDAQFNMPFAAALALTSGQARVVDFDDAPSVALNLSSLMSKVKCVADEELEQAFPSEWRARVVLKLNDGTVIERRTQAFRGSPANPASREEVHQKVSGLVNKDWAQNVVDNILLSRGAAELNSSSFLKKNHSA
jgi:2-methylcitrate dehydratase PrpD